MTKITICGCGALGSAIALHLAHPDRTFLLIDDDRVEDTNLGTTVYSRHHVGCLKAVVLAELLYHKVGCIAEPSTRTLTRARTILLWQPDLVVDSFDNTEARRLTHRLWVPTVHVGVSATRVGAIIWDGRYQVPQGPGRGNNPICTHELGRPILRLTAALASNVIEHYLATDEQRDVWVTEDGRTYT